MENFRMIQILSAQLCTGS